MQVNNDFKHWALSFSGCDGGDIGSPDRPSLWFCGIEWGGGHENDTQKLLDMFSNPELTPSKGYEDWVDDKGKVHSAWKANISYIYNWQAMKLLSAFEGGKVKEYKYFAQTNAPFVTGSVGYFKMNLYPLGFKNTSQIHWRTAFSEATGFATKNEYIEWIRQNRFWVMRDWVEIYKPKVIICTGKTYQNDFTLAFSDESTNFTIEIIENHEMVWGTNQHGTTIFIVPFMVNKNGLTRNDAIQKFGERMRSIVKLTLKV